MTKPATRHNECPVDVLYFDSHDGDHVCLMACTKAARQDFKTENYAGDRRITRFWIPQKEKAYYLAEFHSAGLTTNEMIMTTKDITEALRLYQRELERGVVRPPIRDITRTHTTH